MTDFDDLSDDEEGSYTITQAVLAENPMAIVELNNILIARSELNGKSYDMWLEYDPPHPEQETVYSVIFYWKPRKDTVKERIEIIQTRLENASEGPWRADKRRIGGYVLKSTIGRNIALIDSDYVQGVSTYTGAMIDKTNADFIEHSRDDIEWLLEELKKARQGKGGF